MKIIGLSGFKESGKSTAYNFIQKELPGDGTVVEIQLAKKLKDVCAEVFSFKRSWLDDQNFKEKVLVYTDFSNRSTSTKIIIAFFFLFSLIDLHRSDYLAFSFDFLMLILAGSLFNIKQPIILNQEKLTQVLDKFSKTYNPEIHNKHIGKTLRSPRECAQYIGTEVLREGDPDIHCRTAIEEAKKTGAKVGVVTDMRFKNEYDFFAKDKDFIGGFFVLRPEKVQALKEQLANGVKVHASETEMLDMIEYMNILDNSKDINNLHNELKTKLLPVLKNAHV